MKLGIYQHFSGDLYEVISVGHAVHGNNTDESPGEEVVIYQAQYVSKNFGPNHFWVREVGNFLENVEHEGRQVPRFTYIGENV